MGEKNSISTDLAQTAQSAHVTVICRLKSTGLHRRPKYSRATLTSLVLCSPPRYPALLIRLEHHSWIRQTNWLYTTYKTNTVTSVIPDVQAQFKMSVYEIPQHDHRLNTHTPRVVYVLHPPCTQAILSNAAASLPAALSQMAT